MPLTRTRIGSAILVVAILAIFLGVGRWALSGPLLGQASQQPSCINHVILCPEGYTATCATVGKVPIRCSDLGYACADPSSGGEGTLPQGEIIDNVTCEIPGGTSNNNSGCPAEFPLCTDSAPDGRPVCPSGQIVTQPGEPLACPNGQGACFGCTGGASSGGNNSVGFCGPVCGDGIIMRPEECDDDNTINGDGCSSTCQEEEEDGSSSSGGQSSDASSSLRPSAPECGDGTRQSVEECDDGNLQSGDGCDSSCKTEEGWKCELPESASSGGGTSGGGSSGGTGGQSSGDTSSDIDVLGGSCAVGLVCITPGAGCPASECPPGTQPIFTWTTCAVGACSGGCYSCRSASSSSACTDPDMQDPRIATTVTRSNGQSLADTCHQTLVSWLLEATCDGLGQRARFCPKGFTCSNGACTVPDPQDAAYDSGCTETDGGINIAVAGSVEYVNPRNLDQTFTVSDTCISADVVGETYCVNVVHGFIAPPTYYERVPIRCPAGTTCSNGACQ